MAKVLRFPNSSQGGRNAKTRGRLVRRVMRRTSSFRPRGIGTVSTAYASPVPARCQLAYCSSQLHDALLIAAISTRRVELQSTGALSSTGTCTSASIRWIA